MAQFDPEKAVSFVTGLEVGGVPLGRPVAENAVGRKIQSHPKITLSASRDILFDKLRLSQSNVRHVKASVSIEELAEGEAHCVARAARAARRPSGAGRDRRRERPFEIPAGGRRYRALELLVSSRRLARTAPVPRIVRTDGLAEEDSLAENVQRAPLHPLDQFRAFQAMRDKGRGEEEIAAAFFVAPGVVRQRLKLDAVSPVLLEVYAEAAMTLEQLKPFTVNLDPRRLEQVWEVFAKIGRLYERPLRLCGGIRTVRRRVTAVGRRR